MLLNTHWFFQFFFLQIKYIDDKNNFITTTNSNIDNSNKTVENNQTFLKKSQINIFLFEYM